MAYQIGVAYHIKNMATGKYLNIYGNEQVSNGRTVNTHAFENVNAQKWIVRLCGDGGKIYSALSPYNYALNIDTNEGGHCTIMPASGNINNANAVLDLLTIDPTNNLYRIKMLGNHNSFLTDTATPDADWAESNNVCWNFAPMGDNSVWKIEQVVTLASNNYTYPTPYEVRTMSQPMQTGHTGIDVVDVPYDSPDDVPIYAFADGYVTRNANNTREGYTIRIKHGKLLDSDKYIESRYLHLKYPALIAEGQAVSKGQLIGYMGTTGNSTGVHLHFEIPYKTTSDFSIPSSYYDYEGFYNPWDYLPDYINRGY